MHHHSHQLSANVSIMFTELAYPERFSTARSAGFDLVETWWPFASPSPDLSEIEDWASVVRKSGVKVDAINCYAGDMPSGERGVCVDANRHDSLIESLPSLLRLAEVSGTQKFNLLYGQTQGDDSGAQVAAWAYRSVAGRLADIGGLVLIEPLAAGLNGSYPLRTGSDVATFMTTHLSDVPNLALLLDTFHLSMNGDDPVEILTSGGPVGHVQIADAPGRGEPGSGTVAWDKFFTALSTSDYDGVVGCEYKPTTLDTADSLTWVDDFAD